MKSYSQVVTLYVSQATGNDSCYGVSSENDCFGNGPLQSIEKALEAIAEIRRVGGMQPICIKVLGKSYQFQKPLWIENIDLVTIEPVEEHCMLSGGIKIDNFVQMEYQGIPCFGTYIQDVKEGKLHFTDLYVDGQRADLTRYPEEGVLYPESVEINDTDLFAGSKWIVAKEGDIPKFKNIEDCIISFCHYWIDEHSPISSYDEASRKLSLKYRSIFTVEGVKNIASRMEYYIENVGEMLKKPNQWYLDRPTGMLYYIPNNAEQSADRLCVYAPIVSDMINIKNCHNLSIRGFAIANTKGDAKREKTAEQELFASDEQAAYSLAGVINMEQSSFCSITHCKIHNFGLHGLAIKNGCHHIRIRKNSFYDGGGGALSITGSAYGENADDNTYDITITDNYISHCGKRYFASCGILIRHAYNNIIAHNEISHLQYTGISVGWIWGYGDSITKNNIIEYNYIHHIGQGHLSDMGGIYLLGKQPGTVVRNNHIHDVISRNYGGWGIYTDEGSSYITVENNVVYNTSDGSYHQHYGCMNVVRNNIFAFSRQKPLLAISRGEMHTGLICEGNIYCNDDMTVFANSFRNNEVAIYTLHSDNNIIYDFSGKEPVLFCVQDKEQDINFARQCGLETNSIICNPQFTDVSNYDFSFANDSAIEKINFKPIDMKSIGVTV